MACPVYYVHSKICIYIHTHTYAYIYIHIHIHIDILYALRDSAEATNAWGLEAWCEGCELPEFWCPWWSLRCLWRSFGVPGRPWWVPGGPLGLTGMSGERLGVSGWSWGILVQCQGLPRGFGNHWNTVGFHTISTNLPNHYHHNVISIDSHCNVTNGQKQ